MFIVDYHFHKLKMPLTDLMNELHNVEHGRKGKSGDAHATIGSS